MEDVFCAAVNSCGVLLLAVQIGEMEEGPYFAGVVAEA
jgi:hypothetical protein